jgi:hypothetical protein
LYKEVAATMGPNQTLVKGQNHKKLMDVKQMFLSSNAGHT